ncbi:MAG: hypothetical protein IK955_06635, partial [Clostridia bacterium]|nr:hypothetical protein [Clostridia bacterium]
DLLRFAQDDSNKDHDKVVKQHKLSVRRKASNTTNAEVDCAKIISSLQTRICVEAGLSIRDTKLLLS